MSSDVVIVAAVRTPIGKFNGSLSDVPSYDLGAIVIQEVLKRANVPKDSVSEVLMGQVLTAGQGMNPARHAALKAGLPNSVPACTINQVCGSGLRVVAMGFQAIRSGDASIVVAGGQESMSLSPHCVHMRKPTINNTTLVDSMYKDGLTDCVHNCHMGDTAENVAHKFSVTRKEQDEFACTSQQKAAAAEGKFRSEIISVPVKDRKGIEHLVSEDEFPRPDTTVEVLNRLRTSFTPVEKTPATVTAGNSAGINDGAAAVLMMAKCEAEKRSLQPMCSVVSWAHVGIDPLIMGTGPIPAITKALSKAGWKSNEVDLFEINEAFAAQSVAVLRELKLDPKKVNVNGGSIALGHPLGASGTRILVTLLYEMQRRNARKGVASLCIGGGMGIALCVERK